MKLGAGRAEAISDAHISALATELGCHPAALEAISIVESNGFGWFKDGRIKILFEKHWFYKLLPAGAKRNGAVSAGLARAKWVSPKNGGYKDQSNADARYRLLTKAIAIDEEAALQSISIGRFQIMGFNFALCGFTSAKQMWTMFLDSEVHQLRAFANFLRGKNLLGALRGLDFQRIETVYNGGGLNGAYAKKMRAEYEKLRSGKWKSWQPGKATAPKPVAPSPAPTPTPKPQPTPAPATGGLWSFLTLILTRLFGAK